MLLAFICGCGSSFALDEQIGLLPDEEVGGRGLNSVDDLHDAGIHALLREPGQRFLLGQQRLDSNEFEGNLFARVVVQRGLRR